MNPKPTTGNYFGNWLSERMAKRGWSMYRTAQVVGVSDVCVRKWVNGATLPSRAASYVALSEAFQVSIASVVVAAAGGNAPYHAETLRVRTAADRPYNYNREQRRRTKMIKEKRDGTGQSRTAQARTRPAVRAAKYVLPAQYGVEGVAPGRGPGSAHEPDGAAGDANRK